MNIATYALCYVWLNGIYRTKMCDNTNKKGNRHCFYSSLMIFSMHWRHTNITNAICESTNFKKINHSNQLWSNAPIYNTSDWVLLNVQHTHTHTHAFKEYRKRWFLFLPFHWLSPDLVERHSYHFTSWNGKMTEFLFLKNNHRFQHLKLCDHSILIK